MSTNGGAIAGPLLGGYIWEQFKPKGPFIFSIFAEIVIGFTYLLLMPIMLCQTSSKGIITQK